MDQIDGNQTTLTTLHKSAQSVLVALPTSEAKMAIKKELLEIQNKYEELQYKVYIYGYIKSYYSRTSKSKISICVPLTLSIHGSRVL